MSIEIKLVPLEFDDKEKFILDNQEAFNYGALEEFGLRDNNFEEEGQIISRGVIEKTIERGTAYRIIYEDKKVGGVIVSVKGTQGSLDIFFVSPNFHSKGIGTATWHEIEKLYPEVLTWETCTPYFEKRNIHFYVNRLGFHITEFFNDHNPDPNEDFPPPHDDMFKFEKKINRG